MSVHVGNNVKESGEGSQSSYSTIVYEAKITFKYIMGELII